MSIKNILITAVFVCALFSNCAGKEDPLKKKVVNPRIVLTPEADNEYTDGYIRQAFAGILRFYGESFGSQVSRGLYYDVVNCHGRENVGTVLKELSEEGTWDIIVLTGANEALAEVAAMYPAQRYALTDDDKQNLPNVRKYVAKEHEGSFLVGAAAALKANEDGKPKSTFGFIGGMRGETIARFETGFIQGIHYIDPDATIEVFYANSWSSPGLAENQSTVWFQDGVFAIFPAAGGTGKGVIKAASTFRLNGADVWAIGVDMDQFEEGLYSKDHSSVYTSMIKRVDAAVFDALVCVRTGTFAGGEAISLDLAKGGVGWTDTNPAMSEDIKNKLKRIETSIIEGDIVVSPFLENENTDDTNMESVN